MRASDVHCDGRTKLIGQRVPSRHGMELYRTHCIWGGSSGESFQSVGDVVPANAAAQGEFRQESEHAFEISRVVVGVHIAIPHGIPMNGVESDGIQIVHGRRDWVCSGTVIRGMAPLIVA